MSDIKLNNIELGDTGSESRDKINNNNVSLKKAIDNLDTATIKNTDISQMLGTATNKVPSEKAISDTLANYPRKSEVLLGTIQKGSKANEAEIKAVANPSAGDTYRAIDTNHYWSFDGTQWNDIGKILPDDLAPRVDGGGNTVVYAPANVDLYDKLYGEVGAGGVLNGLIPYTEGTHFTSNTYHMYYQNQTILKGKPITAIQFTVSGAGIFNLLVGKNINSGSYTYKTIPLTVINGIQTITLKNPITLASDEWIGFGLESDPMFLKVADGGNPLGGGYYYKRNGSWAPSSANLCVGIYTSYSGASGNEGDIPRLDRRIEAVESINIPNNIISYTTSKNEDITALVKAKERVGVYIITPVSANDTVGRYHNAPSNYRIVDKYPLFPNTKYRLQVAGELYPGQELVFLYKNPSDIGAAEYYYMDTVKKELIFTTKDAVYLSFQVYQQGDSAGKTDITYTIGSYVSENDTIISFVESSGIYLTRQNSPEFPVGTNKPASSAFKLINKLKLQPNTEYFIEYDPNQKLLDSAPLLAFLYENGVNLPAAYYPIVNGKVSFVTNDTAIYLSLQTSITAEGENFNITPTLKIKTAGVAYSLVIAGESYPLEKLINPADEDGNESNQFTANFDSCIKLDASTPRNESDAKFYKPWIDGDIVKTKVPVTMQERLILNDEPVELILKNSNGIIYEQEASMIEVNGEHRIYYTGIANITKNYICFCTIDLATGKITNHLDPVIGNGYGGAPNNREANCSHVFKNGNYIYCVATNGYGVRSDNGVFLYRSTDGISFQEVGALHNNSVAYRNFGNHWIIPEPINGEYYWFFEGRDGTTWETSVAKSTNIEGPYTKIGKINGLGSNGMAGGICVYYHNGKFRMFYHYGLNGNLPTVIGYSETTLDNILQFTKIYVPLLGITRKPWGDATDQIADPAVYEFNGNVYFINEYTMNSPSFKSHLYLWQAQGLTLDKLFD